MENMSIKDDDDDLDDQEDLRNLDAILKQHQDTFEDDDDDDDDDDDGGGYQDVNDQDNFTHEVDRFPNSEGQDYDHNWASDQTNFLGKFTSTPCHVDQTPPSFKSSFPQTTLGHGFDELQRNHGDEETLDTFVNNNNNNVQQQQHFEAEGDENQFDDDQTEDYENGIDGDPTAFVRDFCRYASVYVGNVAGAVSSDKNQEFFGEVGSRGDGQLQQMKILWERMNEKCLKSEEDIKQLNEELVSRERIIKYMEAQIKEYLLENGRHVKQNHDLDINYNNLLRENENLIKKEENLHAKVTEKDMLIESLENEIKNLRSTDFLNSTKQQHDRLVAQLEERHERELLPLREDLQRCKARIVEQEQTIKDIRSEKDEYVKEFQQKNDTIVRLNQNLHYSQEQFSKMVSMKNVDASGMNMLLSQIEELKLNQRKVEDLNKALEEENVRLNYQFASQQQLHNLNRIVLTNGMRGQNDDSYNQLNIKNPNGITDADMTFTPGNNLENLSNSKTFPADKLMGMFNHVKSQNVELKEQLKKANDEVKRMEGEIREERNLLKQKIETKIQQLPCDGNCTTSSTLNEELRDLKARNKSLASLKKNLESESLIKEDHMKQLKAEIDKFSADKIALQEKFDNEIRIALEKCNSQWSEKLNQMLEASRLDANLELERLREDNEDNEIKLARVQQDYLECCERIDSLEKEYNAEWQARMKEIEDSHKTQILTMKDFYILQQNSQVSKTTTDSKSIQVELNDKSKKELLELNERVGKLHSALQISESMKHQLETTLQERNDVINSKEIILQNRMREIERLNDDCLKLERDIKDQEAKVRQKVEEEVDGFIMQCIKQMKIMYGRDFDNKWPWSQKMKYLLLIKRDLDSKKNETSTKESNLMQKVGDLEKMIDSLENESLAYIRLNTELRDQNLKLSERLSEVNSELESLRGSTSKIVSVQRDYEKAKKKLDEYKLENRNLHTDAKKSEAKVQQLEKEVDKMRTRLESTCSENGERLKNELTDAVNKLMESRRIICNLESESKRRLEEMMQSMEREKEDSISQLAKNFQRDVMVLEKEKRILNEQNEIQVKKLKLQLKELLAEKKALEYSDLSELLSTYKVGVEDMKRFYDTRVKELDQKEKEYVKARCRLMEVTRKTYLHALVNYLNERFENSTAIEIMAKVEVRLDSISPSHIDLETFDQGSKTSLKEPPSHGSQQASQRTYRSASQLSSHQTSSHASRGIPSFRLNDYGGR